MIPHTDDREFTVPVTLNRESRVWVTNIVNSAIWWSECRQIPSAGGASTACRRLYSSVPIAFSLSIYIQHALLTLWERFITILTLKWVDGPACLRYWDVRAHNTLFGAVS